MAGSAGGKKRPQMLKRERIKTALQNGKLDMARKSNIWGQDVFERFSYMKKRVGAMKKKNVLPLAKD